MRTRSKSSPGWLGLDVGGTRIKGGVLDFAGRTLAREIEATQPGQSLERFESQLDAICTRLIRSTGGKIAGFGVAITGPVDPRRGCVYLPGKIAGLDRHATVPYLRRRWKVPVVADNDGRLACFAEWKAGAGRGKDNLLVVTLGTGIGSGVVFDGRLLTDKRFQAGTQCGHFVIDVHGPRCLTGANGTGESVASVTAIVQEVRAHAARGLPVGIAVEAGREVRFEDIVVAVRRKDPVVTGIFERWLDRLAAVLLNGYYAYSPDLILLAGGPSRAGDSFVGKLQDRLEKTAFRVPVGHRIPVRVAKFGEDAGWVGAALFARESAP